jgi:thioredoxin reductase
MSWDVLVVGGGPAGLSAALLLGRMCRRVLLVDAGRPRNRFTGALHGFLTRDGTPPEELRAIGRAQLRASPNVTTRDDEAVDARRAEGGFVVTMRGAGEVSCRKLILAPGVVDEVPEIPGLPELYGRCVFHCPVCDAFELRDQPIAVHGEGAAAAREALALRAWTRDVTLLTDGGEASHRERLDRHGIAVRRERVLRLEDDAPGLRIVLAGGELRARALFFRGPVRLASALPERLGGELTDRGVVATGHHERTSVPGLFVAGDASRDVQLAIIAAAEGAQAAIEAHKQLLDEDFA